MSIVVLKRDGATPDPDKNNDFKWERLPGNVYISATSGTFSAGDDFFTQDGIKDNSASWSTEVSVGGSVSKYNRIFQKSTGAKDIRYIMFNPDGTIGSSNLSFFLAEGLIEMDGDIVLKEKGSDGKNSTKPSGAIGFELNRFTGRVKYYETLY